MPIVIIFKNGLNVVLSEENLNAKEWKPGRVLKKKAVNGHEVLIITDAVAIIEHMPDEEYRLKLEEIEKKKEAERQGPRIARPVFVTPKKLN